MRVSSHHYLSQSSHAHKRRSVPGIHYKARDLSIEPVQPQMGKPAPSIAHFLVAVGLPAFLAMAAAKAFAAGTWDWWNPRFPFKLSLLAFYDFVFLMGWMALGGLALILSRKHLRLSRGVRGGFLILSALIVCYGLANIWIYSALRMALTYPLLMMAGEGVRASLSPYVNAYSVAALVIGPVIYLAVVFRLLRAQWPSRRNVHIALAVLILLYGSIGSYGYARWLAGGPTDGLARNPHWALIASTLDHWRGESPAALDVTAPASYQQDFFTFGQRPVLDRNPSRSPVIKNVIVVVLESTGTQFLSVYGSSYPTTPCLQAEAENSLIFRNVYSNAGYTLHAMMPLVLSLYPGTGWKIYPESNPHLPGTSPALALHNRGYRTAFMTGAMLEFHGSRHFFEGRGFDLVQGAEDFQKMGVGAMVSSWGMDDPPVFDNLLSWIAQQPATPFFAMVWTQQTHHPYALAPYQHPRDFIQSPSGERSELLNLHLNGLKIADEQLGRVFAFLRQHHLEDSTLVVVTGDHGEAFGFPHPWMFHGTALYQESVNVPCILWNPRLFSPGTHSDAGGAHVDLNPTIFDLLGVPPPAAWQGTSLLDRARSNRAYFTCNTGNLLEGLRDGNDKFIYNVTLGREELFDLTSDPNEQNNLAKLQPDRCRQYRQRLSAWATFEQAHLGKLVAASPVK